MAVLTHDELIQRIKNGEIVLSPYTATFVGPASIDLTLGNTFRIFKKLHETIELKSENFDPDGYTELITVHDRLVLQPNETVLGVTVEKLMLPPTLCGWIQGRSRFARIGLMVHITSSFIQPGVSNHQVLEIFNAGPMPIALYPGVAICQIILEETKGSARYSGLYKDQKTP